MGEFTDGPSELTDAPFELIDAFFGPRVGKYDKNSKMLNSSYLIKKTKLLLVFQFTLNGFDHYIGNILAGGIFDTFKTGRRVYFQQ